MVELLINLHERNTFPANSPQTTVNALTNLCSAQHMGESREVAVATYFGQVQHRKLLTSYMKANKLSFLIPGP